MPDAPKFLTATVDGITIRYPAGPLPDDARVAVLSAAFDRVKNPDHWKNPIDAYITIDTPEELATVLEAIEFYTATSGTARKLHRVGDADVYRITAPGYYAGPAN